VEAALAVRRKLAAMGKTSGDIAKVVVRTQRPCMDIIDKHGPLHNPADRDHCIQYMIAVPLIFGRLTAADYEDAAAADPRIDELRAKMVCIEDPAFTRDYYDPAKRSIANALGVQLTGGTKLDEVVVEYPIGHRRRRSEGLPLLEAKFRRNLARRFPEPQQARILAVSLDREALARMAVHEYVDLYAN
jgi:2-methylcitrate dehydratase